MASGWTFTLLLVTCLVATSAALPAQGAEHAASRQLTQTKPNKSLDVKVGDSASSVFKRLGKYKLGKHLLSTNVLPVLEATRTKPDPVADPLLQAPTRQLTQTTPNKAKEPKVGDTGSGVFKRLGKYKAGN